MSVELGPGTSTYMREAGHVYKHCSILGKKITSLMNIIFLNLIMSLVNEPYVLVVLRLVVALYPNSRYLILDLSNINIDEHNNLLYKVSITTIVILIFIYLLSLFRNVEKEVLILRRIFFAAIIHCLPQEISGHRVIVDE